jgi:hypothetical protein
VTNYIFDNSTPSYWQHETDTINVSTLGAETEEEKQSFILDSLTHEHLHKAIEKVEPQTTSCLFDAIGWKLRSKRDQEILEFCVRRRGKMTWKQVIKERGLTALKRAYLSYFPEMWETA